MKEKLKVLCDMWPTQIYVTYINDVDNLKNLEALSDIQTSVPESWTIPCNTSLFENSKIYNDSRLEDLTLKIYNEVINYCIQLNVNLIDYKLIIRDMWVNNYDIYTGQELHIHTNCHISGIYIADSDENSGDIVFESPLSDKEMLELPTYNFNNLLKISAEKNKLILFRSWLRHGVQSHKHHTKRKTIAFNCILEPIRT